MTRRIPTLRQCGVPRLKPKNQQKREYKQRSEEYKQRSKFYRTEQWGRFRRMFLRRNPLCADCMEKGRSTPSAEVHHIEKLVDRPDKAVDPDNCMGLCKSCHSRRTGKGE